ncbi:MAG: hypothetical protein ACREBE_26325, partial [bacterium]
MKRLFAGAVLCGLAATACRYGIRANTAFAPPATPALPQAASSGTCAARFDNGGPRSTWAFFGPDDTLRYRTVDA